MSDKLKKELNEEIVALTPRQQLIARMNLVFGREMGDVDYQFSSQKTVAIREIQDNSVDALRKIGGGLVRVKFNKDYSFEVYDSGPGIPVGLNKTADGKPASSLYLALGVTNAGSNYRQNVNSIGLNGLGGASAQLLSEYTKIEVYRDNKVYKLDFKDGLPGIFDGDKFEPIEDLTYLKIEKDNRDPAEKKLFKTGTKIKMKMNDSLFKSKYPYSVEDLIDRLKGIAFLCPEIKVEIINEHKVMEDGSYQTESFHFEGGMAQMVELKAANLITGIHYISNSGKLKEETVDVMGMQAQVKLVEKDVKVEFAFGYSNNYDYYLESYVNTIKTRLHGFHVTALEKAMVSVLNAKFRSMRPGLTKDDIDPIFEDYSEGLTALVSVNIPEPEFTNQIKEELGGKKALKIFTNLFTDALEKWVNNSKNQEDVRKIADKVILAVRNRQKLKEQQEVKRNKAKLENSSDLPSKLVDCEKTHDEKSEIYIVEGDSALGGMKGARDSIFQALLPLRGKIINVYKSPMKKILENKEVQDIIKCLDAGVGADFDLDRCRYGKVIIATDADTDGQNIACLILILFWRLFPELVQNGRLYRMLTPLFIITEGKNKHYCYNTDERDAVIDRLKYEGKKYVIVRAKGLGESGADVLYETGMCVETRTIQRIEVKDIAEAEEWLNISMGEDVSVRREWIENNPVDLEELGE